MCWSSLHALKIGKPKAKTIWRQSLGMYKAMGSSPLLNPSFLLTMTIESHNSKSLNGPCMPCCYFGIFQDYPKQVTMALLTTKQIIKNPAKERKCSHDTITQKWFLSLAFVALHNYQLRNSEIKCLFCYGFAFCCFPKRYKIEYSCSSWCIRTEGQRIKAASVYT